MLHTLELRHKLTNQDILHLQSKGIILENHSTLFQQTGLKMTNHYRKPYCYEEDSAGYWYAKVHINVPELLNKYNVHMRLDTKFLTLPSYAIIS